MLEPLSFVHSVHSHAVSVLKLWMFAIRDVSIFGESQLVQPRLNDSQKSNTVISKLYVEHLTDWFNMVQPYPNLHLGLGVLGDLDQAIEVLSDGSRKTSLIRALGVVVTNGSFGLFQT